VAIMPIYDGPQIDRSELESVTVEPSQYGHMSPCRECTNWFVTVHRYDDLTVIRAWHHKTCPAVTEN
jgi:hypothetical protein